MSRKPRSINSGSSPRGSGVLQPLQPETHLQFGHTRFDLDPGSESLGRCGPWLIPSNPNRSVLSLSLSLALSLSDSFCLCLCRRLCLCLPPLSQLSLSLPRTLSLMNSLSFSMCVFRREGESRGVKRVDGWGCTLGIIAVGRLQRERQRRLPGRGGVEIQQSPPRGVARVCRNGASGMGRPNLSNSQLRCQLAAMTYSQTPPHVDAFILVCAVEARSQYLHALPVHLLPRRVVRTGARTSS